jgi:hypothetical protein
LIPSYVTNSNIDITYHIYMINREYEIVYDKRRDKWLGVYLAFGQWHEMSRRECFRVLEGIGIRRQRIGLGERVEFCPLYTVSI